MLLVGNIKKELELNYIVLNKRLTIEIICVFTNHIKMHVSTMNMTSMSI